MQDEKFEICSCDGKALGVAPRSRVHREGLWHRAANVVLLRSDGQLILQRRQEDKDVCPQLWDLSVAEHLRPGESYRQAAARGLREELAVEGVALQPLGAVMQVRLVLPELGIKDYELQQTFYGHFDGELCPDPVEVAELATMAWPELREALDSRPQVFTPWLRRIALQFEDLFAQRRSPDSRS